MIEIKTICLMWRCDKNNQHHIGTIEKKDGVCQFQYNFDKFNVKPIGFDCYTEFPDLEKIYTENVIEIFGRRLMNTKRNDLQDLYEFWGVDLNRKNDKFYMLARTQGLLPTDSFEFIPIYYPSKDLTFIAELERLTPFVYELALNSNVELNYKYRDVLTTVYCDDMPIGVFLNAAHNSTFFALDMLVSKLELKPKLTVHCKYLHINKYRIFVKVSF